MQLRLMFWTIVRSWSSCFCICSIDNIAGKIKWSVAWYSTQNKGEIEMLIYFIFLLFTLESKVGFVHEGVHDVPKGHPVWYTCNCLFPVLKHVLCLIVNQTFLLFQGNNIFEIQLYIIQLYFYFSMCMLYWTNGEEHRRGEWSRHWMTLWSTVRVTLMSPSVSAYVCHLVKWPWNYKVAWCFHPYWPSSWYRKWTNQKQHPDDRTEKRQWSRLLVFHWS